MLTYDQGDWGVGFIWQLRGSVIPKAACWAIPSAAFAVGIHFLLHREYGLGFTVEDRVGDKLNTSQVWTGYNFLIAFLLTFRTGKAYSRWWEGGTLLRQARGEWFNAYSSLIAFSSNSKKPKDDVLHFQRGLATLFSHLFCASLNTIAQVEEPFDVLDLAPLNENGVEFLSEQEDKVELLVVWIQRLVVSGLDGGIVAVPPPVLSRVFQEISRGVVNLNEVRKISEYLFPFPYAQLTTCILLLHTMLAPVAAGMLLDTWYWCCIFTLFSVFAFWSLNYVAAEIECPFGDDDNDLPMVRMSTYFNRTLLMLLKDESQVVPLNKEADIERIGKKRPSIVKDFIGAGSTNSNPSKDRLPPVHLKIDDIKAPPFKADSEADAPTVSPALSSDRQGGGIPGKGCEAAEALAPPIVDLPLAKFEMPAPISSLEIPAPISLKLPDEWEPADWTTQTSTQEPSDAVDPPALSVKLDDQISQSHVAAAVLANDPQHS
eukprot:CAMPEP_0115322664 /NCGR_PEP_ID=MMETSP0270-20121206/81523_1 /TAXON_ID=71861 /ORGANISM="Scrippsiella trochoidea, Strain CCMP3099" /LENGTH=487 /DNA_ID=CAMNT_0002742645 /DNA_START=17 /DNA_END=1477 /DNA_ORIENTATION=-